MFDSLKKKLSSWIKSSTNKVKEVVGTKKAVETKVKEKQKKVEKIEKKVEKAIERKIRARPTTRREEERQIAERVLEDIEEQKLEIKGPEERTEEYEKEQEVQEIEKQGEELEQQEETEREKSGFFSRIFNKITGKFKITEEYYNEIFSELETILLENNVALQVVEHLQSNLKKELVGKEIEKGKLEEEIKSALKNSIESMLKEPFDIIERVKTKKPFVIILFGINGSGKTTTIAKLAYMFKQKKLSVVLAAADTFRAASIEQLQEHGKKLGIEVIKSQYNSDPASVAFDAIKHAQSKKVDIVLIDTAGRMHTKDSLMKEMEKIVRVSKPDLKIFIGESITGNDATEQAKTFNEAVGIDGIILSKQDVDEKGGTSLSVSYITGKPILFLGMGQEYKDLQVFNKKKLIESLGL